MELNTQLLTEIRDLLKAQQCQERLGFLPHNPEQQYRIYANRTAEGFLWYTMMDRQVVGIPQQNLRGFIQNVTVDQEERRGKPCYKMHLTVKGDRVYSIEAGHDAWFSKNVVSAIAAMTPEQLAQPVTLSVKPASDNEETLFCSLFVEGSYIKGVPIENGEQLKAAYGIAISKLKELNN